jgi:acyl dehydratase
MTGSQHYFDDLSPGMTFEFGDYPMTEDEIIRFGQAYDPQSFHIEPDPPGGAAGPGLMASGWHTCAATMRMIVEHFICPDSALPSPGHDELRWLRPVRPGDRLHVKVTVLETRASVSKPDRGVVKLRIETVNQHDQVVLTFVAIDMLRRRRTA